MSKLARWCFSTANGWWGLGCSHDRGDRGQHARGQRLGGSFSLPNTDSQAAVNLLTHNFRSASGEGDQVVIQATHGATIKSATVRTEVSAALARVAKVPGVVSIVAPTPRRARRRLARTAPSRLPW